MASSSNLRTSLRRHNVIGLRAQHFREQKHRGKDQSRPHRFRKQINVQFKLCQAISHVQTARGSHDLNMDFAASYTFA